MLVVLLLGLGVVVVIGGLLVIGSLWQTRQSGGSTQQTQSEPDEPCRIEGDAGAHGEAQTWCAGGMFTLVNVSHNSRSFVVILQFSKKGYSAWTKDRYAVLNGLRHVVDKMATGGDMNVGISLHNPLGQMVGGCVRQRAADEAICNGKD